MHKIIKYVLIVIGVIAAVASFFMMPDPEDPEAINSAGISLMFAMTWVLLAVAAILALFWGLKKMVTTPGGLKKALFALGGLVVVFILGYALSSGDEAQAVVDTFSGKDIQPEASTVKTIGMLLNVFFFMTGIAVLLMVIPGVKKLFGK